MKTYRLVTLVAAVLITVVFTWMFSRQEIGPKQGQAIEASMS